MTIGKYESTPFTPHFQLKLHLTANQSTATDEQIQSSKGNCIIMKFNLTAVKSTIFKIRSYFASTIRSFIVMKDYWLNNYKEVIWIIGDGRSGTTWVSNLINYDKKYREMYEPFHISSIDEMKKKSYHPYIKPNNSNPEFLKIFSDVFSGKFRHPRVDNGNNRFFYQGLLIKDIFANLFAYEAYLQFPEIKPILLIRNPFAVALSKYKKRHWPWMTDPKDFLNQSELLEDHLYPFKNLIINISENGDYIQRQILIWSILNYIPLHQFPSSKIHVVFYEDILINPNYEISKIRNYANPKKTKKQVNIREEIIRRPSKVSNQGKSIFPICDFKKELTKDQIESGTKVLSHFGFEHLYNNECIPNRSVLENILIDNSPS